MKTILKTLGTLLITSILFTSCKKSNQPIPSPASPGVNQTSYTTKWSFQIYGNNNNQNLSVVKYPYLDQPTMDSIGSNNGSLNCWGITGIYTQPNCSPNQTYNFYFEYKNRVNCDTINACDFALSGQNDSILIYRNDILIIKQLNNQLPIIINNNYVNETAPGSLTSYSISSEIDKISIIH